MTTRADVAQQMVVTVRHAHPRARLEQLLKRLDRFSPTPVSGWSLKGKQTALVRVYRFAELPPPEVVDNVNKLAGVHLERNMSLTRAARPNDALYAEQWALQRMSAEVAWDCAASSGPIQPITVAVIDSGVARAHPDLAARISPASRRVMGSVVDSAVEDSDGHGTLLAGTIAAITNDAIGVASVTWPLNLSLLALKFYDLWNPLNGADAAHAIQYAVDNGARVINASWHVGMFSQVLFDHVKYAADNDVLFVAAAGNEGTNNDTLPVWPASFALPNVVSVMASGRPPAMPIDNLDDRPGFSNYGPATVHIAAPGVDVLSTHYYFATQPPRWRAYTGSSVSAAHVTAAAALVRALRPAWAAAQVRAHLMATVDPSRYLRCIAGGRLNLERAICTLP